MFIEIVIDGIIINKIKVDADLPATGFNEEEFRIRQELIKSYLRELKRLYPNAYFQLAYESRVQDINI